MNTMYKRGQKVRIRKDLVVGNRYPMAYEKEDDGFYCFYEDMEKTKGRIATIWDYDPDGFYYLKEYYGQFTDSMLEPFEGYTKNDLKNGMVVELCNGEKRMVFNDNLMGFDYGINLSAYDDDLTLIVNDNASLTINKVFKPLNSYCGFLFYLKNENLKLLWERN